MSENLEDFMTVEEAALYLGKVTGHICKLCRDGKLEGARKFGRGAWMIPRRSVMNYVSGPRGFAAVKARLHEEVKQQAKSKKAPQSGQDEQDNLSLEDAALLLRMSPVKLRMLCGYGRVAGAFMLNDEWRIPISTVKMIRSAVIIDHVSLEEIDTLAPSDEDFVTVEEAAKILKRSLRQVRQFCLSRRLEGVRKSKLKKGDWLIPISSVLAVKTSLVRQLKY